MRTKSIIENDLQETSKKLSMVQDEILLKQKNLSELKDHNLDNIERNLSLVRKPASLKVQSDQVLQSQTELNQFESLEVKLQEKIEDLQKELKLFDVYDELKSYEIKVQRHQTAIDSIADALKVISTACTTIKQQTNIVGNRPDILKVLEPLRTLPDYGTFMENRAANISSHKDWMELQSSAKGYDVHLQAFADNGTVEPPEDAINAAYIREQQNQFNTKQPLPKINVNDLIYQLHQLETILHCRIIVEREIMENENNLVSKSTYRRSRIIQPEFA